MDLEQLLEYERILSDLLEKTQTEIVEKRIMRQQDVMLTPAGSRYHYAQSCKHLKSLNKCKTVTLEKAVQQDYTRCRDCQYASRRPIH